MTTLVKVPDKCNLCGKKSKFTTFASTNQFGAPDLDTRPPEMYRSTIHYWIRRCPSCGYCAPELTKGAQEMRTLVQSDPYKRQLHDERFPELANSFLCWALIQEHLGKYADAGWAAVHAAWACDDAKPEAAVLCRHRALELFDRAAELGESFMDDPGAELAVRADLLRRTGEYDRAIEACIKGLATGTMDIVRQVLRQEQTFAAAHDSTRHVFSEIEA